MDDTSPKSAKEIREELEKSEQKYQGLKEKRDELNQQAKLIRDERNMLHEEKKKLIEKMKELRNKRDENTKIMRQHKEKRNSFQKQGKELIAEKQTGRKKREKSLPLRLEELKIEIKMLKYKQETTPMATKEENAIIEDIRTKTLEYSEMEKKVQDQVKIEIDLENLDKSIDALFEKADAEHILVKKYYEESQKFHKEYERLVEEVATLITEANKKHEQYIKIKERADDLHKKSIEMLSKILAVKKERRDRYQKQKELIKQQNIKAREAMERDSEKRLDENLEKLKKEGKISFAG
jgi:uncharacterized coiled-coil DUF342 family protein